MPKKTLPLTDIAIRNAKPKTKSYKLSDGNGLYVEILASGGKSWRLKYRFGGQEKRLTFGLWPDVSLKLARQRRDEARTLLAEGIDPGEKRKQEKADAEAQAAEDANTFEVVARDWHAKQVKVWSESHAVKVLGRMEQHLFPAFGHVPIATLRAPAILPTLREIEAKGHHETAKRLRQYCEAVFAFAISTGIAERNVGADLRGALAPGRVTNRPAIIDPKGVAQLLRAIDGYQGSPITVAALRLAPLVFVRPGELRQAEWNEIDLDAADGPRWSIPAAKMKMRRDHVVPLSRQAVGIIEDLRPLTGHGQYLFPCNRTNGRCMSNMALNAALRRMGYEQGEMCAHGFRAMASTLLHELSWASDLIEAQLGHVERNKVKAAYNRAEYLPQRRKMMQAWADYLDKLKAWAKVTPLHAVAGE
ncbi:tyrosine-type recombinase/integrase [Solidesulfovibrio carbinolicus]|uniref:Integrase n=1 Tax=Solidesulfovibrio carbinolicus TaxID=296842 RepID=A0A4P6HJH0_9BACT|nr:integrase arm-type DNA-binding domain-containing protein [Solidesulfovibrio carbinolicus]QAZ67247.1 integrase [Solidesulfovibrio carbinolicus]